MCFLVLQWSTEIPSQEGRKSPEETIQVTVKTTAYSALSRRTRKAHRSIAYCVSIVSSSQGLVYWPSFVGMCVKHMTCMMFLWWECSLNTWKLGFCLTQFCCEVYIARDTCLCCDETIGSVSRLGSLTKSYCGVVCIWPLLNCILWWELSYAFEVSYVYCSGSSESYQVFFFWLPFLFLLILHTQVWIRWQIKINAYVNWRYYAKFLQLGTLRFLSVSPL